MTRQILLCSEAWDVATGTCPGTLETRSEAEALAEFSLSDLTGEHLALMFGAGFSSVGSVLIVALSCGILLNFIRRAF